MSDPAPAIAACFGVTSDVVTRIEHEAAKLARAPSRR